MPTPFDSTFAVVRAIGVEFAKRKLQPVAVAVAVATIVVHALGIWLISQSAWWWLLEIAFIVSTIVIILLATVVWLLLRRVSPPMNRSQRQAVGTFVNKLERIAEHVQTPQPVIIYYVVRDAIRPRQDTFIEGMIHDSTSLGGDFTKLRRDLQ